MKFWDSSAIVCLLVNERHSPVMAEALAADQDVIVWWATPVECVSAIARREREGNLEQRAVTMALGLLDELQLAWNEVEPTESLRAQAARLLRVHPLRASDSLQLAAAITAAESNPRTLPLVALDERLRTAAGREGFALWPETIPD